MSDAFDFLKKMSGRASSHEPPRRNSKTSNEGTKKEYKPKGVPIDQSKTGGSQSKNGSCKKGIFSIGGGDDSSDYESEGPEEPRRTKSNLFKDLLHGGKRIFALR
jgi:hypothetical protein